MLWYCNNNYYKKFDINKIVFCGKNENKEVRLKAIPGKEFLYLPQSLLYLLSFTVRRWPGVIIHTVTALQFSMPLRYRTLDYWSPLLFRFKKLFHVIIFAWGYVVSWDLTV